jgi:hypothetical protein
VLADDRAHSVTQCAGPDTGKLRAGGIDTAEPTEALGTACQIGVSGVCGAPLTNGLPLMGLLNVVGWRRTD